LAYIRLVSKLTKENIWIYVLKLLKEKPMYAYEIKKALKTTFSVNPAVVTVYVTLYRMEGEGLIAKGTANSAVGRPDRKYYVITDLGRETLNMGRAFLKETLDKISE
jgi:PadR family transcriptional regulator, regulatory protein PadR